MVRIGYIGHFGTYHTERGVADALEERAEVDRYQIREFSTEKFLERKYDILLTTHPSILPIEFLREFEGVKIAHYFDLVVGWKGREGVYFPSLKEMDLVLTTEGTDSSVYAKHGINRKFFRQGYNPEWYHPVERDETCDVAFIGHSYGNRTSLISQLKRKYRFLHMGEDSNCRGQAHARVCASSKIMIADNASNYVHGYWSNRIYLHLACKGFVLHSYVPGIEDWFTDEEHVVFWRSREELFEKIDYYLNHDEERERIAAAGHRLVSSRDTWDKRMEEFWLILSKSGLLPTQTPQAE